MQTTSMEPLKRTATLTGQRRSRAQCWIRHANKEVIMTQRAFALLALFIRRCIVCVRYERPLDWRMPP